ncbi:MAG: DUF2281 domain-containing protein [Paenibacillaceae bacterium]
MSVSREDLKRMIDHIADQDLTEVLDFIGYLNMRRERDTLRNLEQTNMTSMEFLRNTIDDEVWNGL